MADDAGRPIHDPSLVSPIGGTAANENVDRHAPKCVGCGRYHGGVNVATRCLEDTVRALRAGTIANVLDATARLFALARYFGQTSKLLTPPLLADAAEQAAVDVARVALALEGRFQFGNAARAPGPSQPVAPKGES
jgi:hypothetical protein